MTATSAIVAGHRNNLDAMRLVGSVLVIVGHSFILTGRAGETPSAFGIWLHLIGVAMFFAISGYLIAGSWNRHPHVSTYLTNRAARILPALVLVTVLTVLVLGPLTTTLPLGSYATSPTTLKYFANVFPVLPQFLLPGVYENLPYPGTVNGSLWTLRVEFGCYAAVLLLALVPWKARAIVIVIAGVAGAIVASQHIVISGSDLSTAANVAVYFAGGALIRYLATPQLLRPLTGLVVLVSWTLVSWVLPAYAVLFSWIALPVVVISLGTASTPVIRRASRFGDLSYGMYLAAFPLQQLVILLRPDASPVLVIVAATLASAAYALVSWHLVEARAMVLKDRLPWMRRPSRTRASAL